MNPDHDLWTSRVPFWQGHHDRTNENLQRKNLAQQLTQLRDFDGATGLHSNQLPGASLFGHREAPLPFAFDTGVMHVQGNGAGAAACGVPPWKLLLEWDGENPEVLEMPCYYSSNTGRLHPHFRGDDLFISDQVGTIKTYSLPPVSSVKMLCRPFQPAHRITKESESPRVRGGKRPSLWEVTGMPIHFPVYAINLAPLWEVVCEDAYSEEPDGDAFPDAPSPSVYTHYRFRLSLFETMFGRSEIGSFGGHPNAFHVRLFSTPLLGGFDVLLREDLDIDTILPAYTDSASPGIVGWISGAWRVVSIGQYLNRLGAYYGTWGGYWGGVFGWAFPPILLAHIAEGTPGAPLRPASLSNCGPYA